MAGAAASPGPQAPPGEPAAQLLRTTTDAPSSKAGARTTSTTPWYTTKTTLVADGTLSLGESAALKASKQSLAYEPWSPKDAGVEAGECPSRFVPPPKAPHHATDLNGIALPDACFQHSKGPHHVFVIGDWGGVLGDRGDRPVPADRRSRHMKSHHRPFVVGADDVAQVSVARQMRRRSDKHPPDYILNVGDNFYWGGVLIKCGGPAFTVEDSSGQWEWVFERVYDFPGLEGKQWLGVLGNHDYGGFLFTHGWDQAIGYTWTKGHPSKGRWVTPAQYWSVKVHYPDFSVDYYFVDSNAWDAFEPDADPEHNLCSRKHNLQEGATCGVQGPVSVEECPVWFDRLWEAQVAWLDKGLAASRAEWQVIVTHFPPEHGLMDWKRLTEQHGVDLLISGHRHQQEVHYMEEGNFLRPTAYVVSGGGGGITSEGLPNATGDDDQYGFMDLTLTKREIMIEAISHGGQLRSRTCVRHRLPGGAAEKWAGGDSLCDEPLPTRAPTPQQSSAAHRVAESFDCSEGRSNWQMLWSFTKGKWCCDHKHICMGAFEQDGPMPLQLVPESQPAPSPSEGHNSEHRAHGRAERTPQSLPTSAGRGRRHAQEPEPTELPQDPATTSSVVPTTTAPAGLATVAAPTLVFPAGLLPASTLGLDSGGAFDCLAGYYNLEREWSKQKRLWCCQHEKLGCNHLYDCNPDDPNNLASVWSYQKAKFCCNTFGVCFTGPAPAPVDFNCNPNRPGNAMRSWPAAQVAYCCSTFQIGCDALAQTAPLEPPFVASVDEEDFDCQTDILDWELMWSVAKQEWCCKHKQLGCVQFEDCNQDDTTNPYSSWPISKKEWCCMHWGLNCPQISTPPVSFKQLWPRGRRFWHRAWTRPTDSSPLWVIQLAGSLAAAAALAGMAVAVRRSCGGRDAPTRHGLAKGLWTGEGWQDELLSVE